jgi:glycosyltransferase involved in cell wall biosynthesis
MKVDWIQWGRRNSFIGPKALADDFELTTHVSYPKSLNFNDNIGAKFYRFTFLQEKLFNYFKKDSLDLGSNKFISKFHYDIQPNIAPNSIIYTLANGYPALSLDLSANKLVHEQVSCALDLAELRNRYQKTSYDLDMIYRRELSTFKAADMIICPSVSVKNYVHSIYPQSLTSVVRYPALNIKRCDKVVVRDKGQKIKLLFGGRIEPVKGAELLFLVAKKFKNIELHLVGDVICNIPKLDNLKVYGKVEHSILLGLLSNMDAILFPSLSEGSSLFAMEALALGVPGIVSVQSGSHYKHHVTGLLFDANEPEELYDLLEMITLNESILNDFRLQLSVSKIHDFNDYKKDLCIAVKKSMLK